MYAIRSYYEDDLLQTRAGTHHGHGGHELGNILEALDADLVDFRLAEGLDGLRDVLDVFLAFARGDRHFLQRAGGLLGLLVLRHGVAACRGGQRSRDRGDQVAALAGNGKSLVQRVRTLLVP